MKRAHCPHCYYPLNTCICESLSLVDTDVAVSILQDPTETKHAKNTARLAALIVPQVKIYVGESRLDFTKVIAKVTQTENSLLIYPSHSALDINHDSIKMGQYKHLILLDGTWRKAKKLWLNNPWLHELDAAKLELNDKSQYSIRKSPTTKALSTLEALAYSLNALEGKPVAPFLHALSAMQQHWQNNQPNSSH